MSSSALETNDKFKLSGWHFIKRIGWTNIFSEEHQNDFLYEACINCELNNGITTGTKMSFHDYFDYFFTRRSLNIMYVSRNAMHLKKFYNDLTKVDLDFFISSSNNIKNYVYDKSLAQIVVVEDYYKNKYAYFSMTNYAFWKKEYNDLKQTFGITNIGGSFVKIGFYSFIDNRLKYPLENL